MRAWWGPWPSAFLWGGLTERASQSSSRYTIKHIVNSELDRSSPYAFQIEAFFESWLLHPSIEASDILWLLETSWNPSFWRGQLALCLSAKPPTDLGKEVRTMSTALCGMSSATCGRESHSLGCPGALQRANYGPQILWLEHPHASNSACMRCPSMAVWEKNACM